MVADYDSASGSGSRPRRARPMAIMKAEASRERPTWARATEANPENPLGYTNLAWTLIDDSLVSLEEQFRDTFMRIHRNALVSITHIEALEKTADGSYQIKLKGVEEKLPVSRRHTREVKLSLKNPP